MNERFSEEKKHYPGTTGPNFEVPHDEEELAVGLEAEITELKENIVAVQERLRGATILLRSREGEIITLRRYIDWAIGQLEKGGGKWAASELRQMLSH